jgi:aminopeptidase N
MGNVNLRGKLTGIALSLLIVVVGPSVARDNYPRAADLDAISYHIQISLNDTDENISGETEILFAAAGDLPKVVPLDFEGFTIDEVKENGQPAQFSRSGRRLAIRLQGSYHRREGFTVSIRYHGSPQDGLYIKKNKYGDRTVFADNWPDRAHHWFPAIDHPYDKAQVEFFVTAPDKYDVVANGDLAEVTSLQNGAKRWHWKESVPIPVYCMVIGVAEFSVLKHGSWNNIPVYYYLFPKDRDWGIKDFGRSLQMLEFYSNLIGPYPYEKLALVESSTRFGGMENSSNIFFPEKSIDGSERQEGTVAHEIAHQWFGDSVTESDWHQLWLSEGFATYFSHLFFERADGRDAFLSLMLADRDKLFHSTGVRRPIHDPSITDLFQLLNENNYQKGGWVLHMLRHLMGDHDFFEGIRDYYRSNRDRNALTEDFQRVMESHYGKRLDWFFKEWIYETGHPVYQVVWSWSDSKKELHLKVVQEQSGTLFTLPVDVEIKSEGGSKREVILMDQRQQTFDFKLSSRPAAVVLDPGQWILKEATVREEK